VKREIELSICDAELVLTLATARDHDEQYLRPGEVWALVSFMPLFADWTARQVATRLRELADAGVVERNRWVKYTAYREATGVVADLDRQPARKGDGSARTAAYHVEVYA
jgi:hypothetical protein